MCPNKRLKVKLYLLIFTKSNFRIKLKSTSNCEIMALLINIGVAVQLILLFIIPTSDSYISLVVIFLFSIISLISLYYLFVYYYLLPDFKQNILVYLTRLLIAFHGLQIIYHMPIEIVLHCFMKQLIFLIKDDLEVVILITQRFNPAILRMTVIVQIIALKTLLKITPVFYLRLNTSKIKSILLFIPILLYVLQIFFAKPSVAGLHMILEYHNIEIPDLNQMTILNRDTSNRKIPLFMMLILALILLILELYSSILHEKIKSTVSSLTNVNRIDVDIRTRAQNDSEQQHVEEVDIITLAMSSLCNDINFSSLLIASCFYIEKSVPS